MARKKTLVKPIRVQVLLDKKDLVKVNKLRKKVKTSVWLRGLVKHYITAYDLAKQVINEKPK